MSSNEAPVKAARSRPARAQLDERRRRRRDPNDNSVTKRLSVPEELLDRTTYQYRWVIDQGDRLKMLERQDWEVVGDDELDGEAPTARHAAVSQHGAGLTTRLMRKYRDWFEDDHAAKQKSLDDEMKAAELGQKVLNEPSGDAGRLEPNRIYMPRDASNKL